jgi:hypothetical protein
LYHEDAIMGAKQASIPTTTQTTQNVNTIPDFMQPYFNTMMGAAQDQTYQKDAQGNVTGMKPYQPYSTNGSDYVAPFSGLQNQAFQGAANLQTPGQFQQGSNMLGNAGTGSLGIAGQAANAGNQYNQMATDPNAMKGFMSPYMQNVVDWQTQQANRQFDTSGAQEKAQAAHAGAFGGSREAIMASENERNRNQAITGIQATGAQTAFQNAQQAQQFGANLGMQGYGTALQGMGQGVQAGLGLGQIGAWQNTAQNMNLEQQAKQGALQQNQQQQAIDQSVRNYETAQQYPFNRRPAPTNRITPQALI